MRRQHRDSTPLHRAPAAQRARQPAGTGTLTERLDASPRQLAQRAQVEASMGPGASREPLQRALDDEEPAQRMSASGITQRAMDDEDALQRQTTAAQRAPDGPGRAVPGGLPANLQSGVEALSGMDMSGVQVHYNSPEPARVNALAYAQGNDIHLASGQEQHLPHEAWHVVQQMQGRVAATTQVGDTPINDSPALEAEADRMGALAQRHRS